MVGHGYQKTPKAKLWIMEDYCNCIMGLKLWPQCGSLNRAYKSNLQYTLKMPVQPVSSLYVQQHAPCQWVGRWIVKTSDALVQTCTIPSPGFINQTRHFSAGENGWRKEAKKMECHFLFLSFPFRKCSRNSPLHLEGM